MSSDTRTDELLKFLQHYLDREQSTLCMHASESPVSPASRAALAHELACRYSSDDPGDDLVAGDMIFGGSSQSRLLKDICAAELKWLLSADHVSFTPLSGLNAADIAICTFASAGDRVLLVSNKHGGHPVFPELARLNNLEPHYIPFNSDTMQVDWAGLEQQFYELQPSLLYFDVSDYLFPFEISQFRRPRNINTVCVYDVSHVLGLLGARRLANPLDFGFDVLVGSTHKSFPGPHKGVFGARSERLAQQFDRVSKLKVSSTHAHHILSLVIALLEFREQGVDYVDRMIENGNAVGSTLAEFGLNPCRQNDCFTRTHQVWLPFETYSTAIESYRRLEQAGVYANFIYLHHDAGWGIRFGMQEMTFRGFSTKSAGALGALIAKACLNLEPSTLLQAELVALLGSLTPFWKSTPTVSNLIEMEINYARSKPIECDSGTGVG